MAGPGEPSGIAGVGDVVFSLLATIASSVVEAGGDGDGDEGTGVEEPRDETRGRSLRNLRLKSA